MNPRHGFGFLALFFVFSFSGCAPTAPKPILSTVPVASLTWAGEKPVLHLRGTPYDMGYQHGSLMRREVRASVKNLLAFANHRLGVPGVGRFFARRQLDRTWARMKPHVPERYLEEMEGLADGAGVSLRDLQRIHALPECAPMPPAEGNLRRYAALIVHHPAREQAFVSAGWLGFIGVLSGVNEKNVSIEWSRSESAEIPPGGMPVPFRVRKILEEAADVKEANDLLQAEPRAAAGATVGNKSFSAAAGA